MSLVFSLCLNIFSAFIVMKGAIVSSLSLCEEEWIQSKTCVFYQYTVTWLSKLKLCNFIKATKCKCLWKQLKKKEKKKNEEKSLLKLELSNSICINLHHKIHPTWRRLQEPSSKVCPPLCHACPSLRWAVHRTQSQWVSQLQPSPAAHYHSWCLGEWCLGYAGTAML